MFSTKDAVNHLTENEEIEVIVKSNVDIRDYDRDKTTLPTIYTKKEDIEKILQEISPKTITNCVYIYTKNWIVFYCCYDGEYKEWMASIPRNPIKDYTPRIYGE